MKTLKDVKVGETATVAKLHGEGPVNACSRQNIRAVSQRSLWASAPV